MFPANAGMNRNESLIFFLAFCVPRKRGDEPEIMGNTWGVDVCSPQTRG